MKTIKVSETQLEAMKKLGIQYEAVEKDKPVKVRAKWTPNDQGSYSLTGSGDAIFTTVTTPHKIGNSYPTKISALKDVNIFKRQTLIRAYDREFGVRGESKIWSVVYHSEHGWKRDNIITTASDQGIYNPQTYHLGATAARRLVDDLNSGRVVLPGIEDM